MCEVGGVKRSKTEVDLLYSCMICHKAFSSKQALRGHMNAHRDEDMRHTTIVVVGETWDEFKAVCHKHHATTCHVLHVLMKAMVKSEKIDQLIKNDRLEEIAGSNPILFNIQEVFLGKPRSGWKREVDEALLRVPGRRCPECGSVDIYEFHPLGSRYWDGRCRRCRAEWLINPSYQHPRVDET